MAALPPSICTELATQAYVVKIADRRGRFPLVTSNTILITHKAQPYSRVSDRHGRCSQINHKQIAVAWLLAQNGG